MLRFLIALAAVGLLFLAWRGLGPSKPAPLVVYCAHDSIFSEQILREFSRRTGIEVALRFDTEATKSLGLLELIVQEKGAPRCDVFWNNEPLGMMDLAGQGLLVPYQGPGFARIPAQFKARDGAWTGFAGRLRVVISNAKTMPEVGDEPFAWEPTQVDLSRVAIAKPLYGTTLDHYSVLWKAIGPGQLQAWHRSWRERGVREVAGNAAVKDLVAQGACDWGYTDTDDFFAAKDEGKPVAMLPVRLPRGETICLPNAVGIIRGTKQLEAAQKLVDFLLSEETEVALARSGSRQIPLGPVARETALPPELGQLTGWAREGCDLSGLGPARAACLEWLKAESLR